MRKLATTKISEKERLRQGITNEICKNHDFRSDVREKQMDASFLLTIEVFGTYGSSFLLTVGGTVSRKDRTQFPDRGNRK